MKTLQIAGFFDIRCDAHTFMKASMHCVRASLLCCDDAQGVEMAQVPPARYRLLVA